ncbi:hypothetical protein [Methanolobus bombayensis]|uniref:hypothetical protein n=1 Tax=Methanolobus bombayensis TaxID=38023 RepID=UPI001AE8B691|nr:hypothetical protein [Methanolobus bombayensis]MBP1908240.1 hypothetical protein [Methanolobus bombayensis]
MIYGDIEFIGIADIPRINTIFGIDNTLWEPWKVILTDKEMEIRTDYRSIHLSLENILIVDRPLPHAILSKIQNASRHGAIIVIDYKKEATIGIGEVVSSMIIAGKKSDVSNLKYMLMSLLGVSADPIIGTMKPEDIRLLCLLSSGINSLDLLIPIFEGDDELVSRTFASLKSKGLVDKYAALTPLGIDLVDRVRGVDKKKLGSDIQEDFDNLATVWNCLDCNMAPSDDETNRIIWKCGNSKLCGNVATVDINKFICPLNIEDIELDIPENTCFMDLMIQTKNDASIVLKSRDFSVIIALYGCLNPEEDIQIRILFSFYLGYTNQQEIQNWLQISSDIFERHCKLLAKNNYLELENYELTNSGLNLVHRKIIGDVSVLVKWTCFEYKSENFKKIETRKKECAKKKILDILQSKHGKKVNV